MIYPLWVNYIIPVTVWIISFGILYLRFRRENPRRNLKIWRKDISKLFIGMIWTYSLNIFLVISSEHRNAAYRINYIVDCLLTMWLCLLLLILARRIGRKYPIRILDVGNYGNPPEELNAPPLSYRQALWYWLIQTFLWLVILTLVKIIVFFALIYPLQDLLLRWSLQMLQNNVIILWIISVIILNIIQCVIQDVVFKRRIPSLDDTLNGYLIDYDGHLSPEFYASGIEL